MVPKALDGGFAQGVPFALGGVVHLQLLEEVGRELGQDELRLCDGGGSSVTESGMISTC